MKTAPRLLDSSAWLEIFAKGNLEATCRREMLAAEPLIVPTVVIFEVYRKLARSGTDDQALAAISFMSRYNIVELSRDISLLAADISIHHKLGMADSIVLAHARDASALLVTLDNDFAGMDQVKVIRAGKN